MKHKRLNRDAWGFSYYPYYQTRLDCEFFHGTVCLIRLTDGGENYWQMPRAGQVQVTGGGMCWLELIPDGENRVITVKYFPDGGHDPARKNYPAPADPRYPPSVWYVDITDGTEYDEWASSRGSSTTTRSTNANGCSMSSARISGRPTHGARRSGSGSRR